MSIATGTRLGRYEIRSKLGDDGMGEVYAHEKRSLGSLTKATTNAPRYPWCVADSTFRLTAQRQQLQERERAHSTNHAIQRPDSLLNARATERTQLAAPINGRPNASY